MAEVIQHPLAQDKIGMLRDKSLSHREVRQLVVELATLLCYEATRELSLKSAQVEAWSGKVEVKKLMNDGITLVPILRAGLGLLPGFLTLLPDASVSVVGIYRDEKTLNPVAYLQRFVPNIQEQHAIILDPMLATGGTALATIHALKASGCTKITAVFLVGSPEGVRRLEEAHPEVPIVLAAIDEKLNDKGYILPGLGDAGDRIFGTVHIDI